MLDLFAALRTRPADSSAFRFPQSQLTIATPARL